MIARIKLTFRPIGQQAFRLHSCCTVYPFQSLNGRLANSHHVQYRGIRTKPDPLRVKPLGDGPTGGEKVLMHRMLEQRQLNISRVARERGWFFPSNNLQLPAGWSYEWPAWVAGWELVPIVTRSHNELILEHYFGMAGRLTPIIFRLDPFAPDFIFQYQGMDEQDIQRKGTHWMDQGHPGAYYYFRMGDDEVFKFSSEFDSCSPKDFILAFGTPAGLKRMMEDSSAVPVLSDDHSARAFAEECDSELIHFEQRIAAIENQGKQRPDPIMALAFGDSTEEPLYPITDQKILALREKYESYKSYGVYSVYTLVPDDEAVKAQERRRKQLQYLLDVEDLEGRVKELKKELNEITDDEGEFEVIKEQSRGRRRKGDKRPETLANRGP
ncbi:hypothetical protein J3R30DRAFT_3441961 [Lentinula aciculospora]|uniref:Uncharacterized protein n=1 Tax=Lentinula aciculospora TaxID=153920 RepID=A0A9W9AMB7_9AGAR|nr:hypothetical protein J3R30DRAFT_3441961 [Lentinula aciculospora]